MKMEMIIPLLVLLIPPQLVVSVVPVGSTIRPVVEVVLGDSRIFSGENIRLKCNIPNDYKFTWRYLWFKGSEQLSQHREHFILWNTRVTDSGKFYCQGVRDSQVGDIHTHPSLPFELSVDGGWAILEVPPTPKLAGDTLKLTCRVRDDPPLLGVFLYKNGFEVMKQQGVNPSFSLANVNVRDGGMYSCRASWDVNRRTQSVISAEVPVQVLEVLSQPVLEIVTDNSRIPAEKMKLICHVQYNLPAPAPPISYNFYKGENRLGTATSENHDLFHRTPGQYRCRASVLRLNLLKWSEPKSFGRESGRPMMRPLVPHPGDPWLIAPQISFPDSSLRLAAESTKAWTFHKHSTATSAVTQPTGASIQSSDPLLASSQSQPITKLPTLQTIKETMSLEPSNISEGSAEMSGDSDDTGSGSDDMPV